MDTSQLPSYPLQVQPRPDGQVVIGYVGPDGFVAVVWLHEYRIRPLDESFGGGWFNSSGVAGGAK